MIHLGRFCCICLNKGQKLEKLLTIQENYLSYYDKLIILIPQMNIDEIKEMVYVCGECKTCIDSMFNFHNTCLSNNSILQRYMRQLCINKNSKFVESIVLHKLNEVEILECFNNVDSSKCKDFEEFDNKIEFVSIEDRTSPTNISNNEQQINNESLPINIKEEIDIEISDFKKMIEDTEICIDDEIKNEDTIVHTEFISCETMKEISNDEINDQGDAGLEDEIHNETNSNIDDIDSLSITSNVDVEKLSDDDISKIDVNNTKNNNGSEENNLENNKIHNQTSTQLDNNDGTSTGETQSSFQLRNENRAAKKQYKCEICNKIFIRTHDFNRHKKVHSGEKPFKCDICSKTFMLKSNLKQHSFIHSNEKPYECEMCKKTFNRIKYLRIHERLHTGEKLVKCDKCDKIFNRLDNFRIHRRTHTGEKPYKCDICNFSFNSTSSLIHHNKIHGKKSFNCEICNKVFKELSRLTKHKITHTDEKPYKCEKCNKSFKLNYQLKRHCETHSDEKLYKCNLCNKTFVAASYLKRHMRSHAIEKIYKCEICRKSFTTNYHCKKHSKTHAGEFIVKSSNLNTDIEIPAQENTL